MIKGFTKRTLIANTVSRLCGDTKCLPFPYYTTEYKYPTTIIGGVPAGALNFTCSVTRCC